jgi:hypothetical protein
MVVVPAKERPFEATWCFRRDMQARIDGEITTGKSRYVK